MGDGKIENSLAFPRESRVRKRWEFLRIYDRGRLLKRPGLRVFVVNAADLTDPVDAASPDAPSQPSASEQRPRLGLAATRKTGNSVTRNRLKRATREAFRLSAPQMRPGVVTVVNFLSSSAKYDAETLRRYLLSAWREGGMFGEASLKDTVEMGSHGSDTPSA